MHLDKLKRSTALGWKELARRSGEAVPGRVTTAGARRAGEIRHYLAGMEVVVPKVGPCDVLAGPYS